MLQLEKELAELKNSKVPPIPSNLWYRIETNILQNERSPFLDVSKISNFIREYIQLKSLILAPAMAVIIIFIVFSTTSHNPYLVVNKAIQEETNYLYGAETYSTQEGGIYSGSLEERLAYLSS